MKRIHDISEFLLDLAQALAAVLGTILLFASFVALLALPVLGVLKLLGKI